MNKPKPFSKTNIKKQVESLSKERLVELITGLCYIPAVSEALSQQLSEKYAEELFDYYDDKLYRAFSPANPERYSTTAAEAIVDAYENVTAGYRADAYRVQLYLTFLNGAAEFINLYGYDEDEIFDAIVVQFRKLVKLLENNTELYHAYREAVEKTLRLTDIGFGLGDSLKDLWRACR